VSHPITPDYEARVTEVQRFWVGSPPERLAFLDRTHIRHLILPGDAGQTPVAWLGLEARYRRAAVMGSSGRLLSLYVGEPGPPNGAVPDRDPALIRPQAAPRMP
jgi:hypothetical protein